MRTDVKVGFAVGGVLLAVLVVYVLVISGGEKYAEVSLSTSDSSQGPSTQPSELAPVVADAAERRTDPFRDTGGTSSDGRKSGDDDRWLAALTTGRIPVMMTQTPAAGLKSSDDNRPADATGGSEQAASNAPASLMPAAAAQPGGARTHVVQQGESFASIAAQVYGNEAYYPYLIRANPTVDPRRLRPGMVISLPDVSQVRATGTEPAAAQQPAGTVEPKTEYKVQAGDSLYRIAIKLYGRPDYVEKLYELNKSTIGANPAHLKTGMVLKLPEPPGATSWR